MIYNLYLSVFPIQQLLHILVPPLLTVPINRNLPGDCIRQFIRRNSILHKDVQTPDPLIIPCNPYALFILRSCQRPYLMP